MSKKVSKKNEMQRLIRNYKDETGEREIDMKKVAKWAVGKGWPLPVPKNPLDVLAKAFSDAAREETRRDSKTGKHIAPTIHLRCRRVESNFIYGLILMKLSAVLS